MTMSNYSSDDLIIFTHIPKTFGSSFMRGVVRPNMIDSKFYYYRTLKKFITDDKNYEFLHGHLPYGLHLFTNRKVKYITFFRDPIDRAISYYFFVQQGMENERTKHPLSEYAKSLSLKEFYQDKRFHNHQSRYTAGFISHKFYSTIPDSLTKKKILQRAEYNLLENYFFFGIFERRRESINLIREKMNWREIKDIPHHKKTQKRLAVEDLDADTLQVLKDAHDLDFQLYEFAIKNFEKQFEGCTA